ncbi:2-hydroxyacid dehydrogenase [Cellulomonas composti]|uniref:2-hydroxyacid dehydrogenase n=1 Tax=Cellulomonas composti TaxID=266130 RepID=UPI001649BA72|nr:2-hydroxyacid dehydrogenase [Cellulomonas composti]
MTRPVIVFPGGEPELAALFGSAPLGERLRALGDLVVHDDLPDGDEAAARLTGADVGLLSVHLSAANLMAIAGRTRLLAFTGTGAASYVDLDETRRHGITVTNVTGYGDRAVAEHALALLLAALRGVVAGDRAVRAGDWSGFPGPELAGSTVAVIGAGAIGRTFAGIVAALGARVLVVDARPVADLAAIGPDVRQVDLRTAFEAADAVSLHLPLLPTTRALITAELLELLRPGAVLVNTARAEVVAPDALVARAARGDLRIALDVFDPEPLPPDDPLLAVPGAVLTPHLGFRTPQALARMAAGAVECVEAFLAGRPLRVVA